MNRKWQNALVICGLFALLGAGAIGIAAESGAFSEATPLEELKTMVTVTKIVDGQYAFIIDPPKWQKHDRAVKALRAYVEEWLVKNNCEATSIQHYRQDYYIVMVTRPKI